MLHPKAKFINSQDYAEMCAACHLTGSENTAEIFSRVGLSGFLEKHPSLSWATVTVVLTGGVLFFETQAEYQDWLSCQDFPEPLPNPRPMGILTIDGDVRWIEGRRGAE